MRRLGTYLIGLFAREALALYGLVIVLLFLIRVLTVADVASVRTEGVGLLLVEAVLSMAPLATAFLYLCLAIGLGRGLRTLAESRELHILHVSNKLGALLGAVAIYIGLGMVAVLALAHLVTPAAVEEERQIRSRVVAELVGTKLVPGRFAQLAPGVTVTVGGRRGDGEITSFFADDSRSEGVRRTYMADSAEIAPDPEGYVLRLRDGAIQYRNANGTFSEVSFAQYDIGLDQLTGPAATLAPSLDQGSIELVASGLATGSWPPETVEKLAVRTAEGLRVLALCLLVFAVAGFPTGRRRPTMIPVEVVLLVVAFVERAASTYLPGSTALSSWSGSVLLVVGSVVLLVLRMRLLRLPAAARPA
jgi:lipopolysaccharide export system permease protein